MGLWYDETFAGRVRFGLKVRRTLFSERSAFQQVEVLETEAFGRVLALDGVFMTSEADDPWYHEMIVHPALTTAPSIRHVLVVGGGDGGTVREVLRHPEVERVVMVEIDRLVVEACRRHLPTVGTAWDDPRLEVRFADAVEFVGAAPEAAFDVVIVDGPDPVGPAKPLFEADFYRGCRRVLRPGGVFVAQTETPFHCRELFLDVVRRLEAVFGRATPYLGPVPLYASGYWSWTLAAPDLDPLALRPERVAAVQQDLQHYTPELHRAAFALPADLRRALDAR